MESNSQPSLIRINAAIGLISAAIVAFQLILMQILSYVQWYHFAYMIISIAMLGFGAAGTLLTIFRKNWNKIMRRFSFLLIITAILIPAVVGMANSNAIRFDSLLIFQDSRHIGRLILTYFIFFLPFLTGALAIGLSFSKFADRIWENLFFQSHRIGYRGNNRLRFHAMDHSRTTTLFRSFAGLFSRNGRNSKNAKPFLRITLPFSAIILLILLSAQTYPSEYKDISKTMLLPESTVDYKKSSPHGLVEIVSSPVLRFAPG